MSYIEGGELIMKETLKRNKNINYTLFGILPHYINEEETEMSHVDKVDFNPKELKLYLPK